MTSGRRFTHVTQVRLHGLHHAYLSAMARDHDASMGAYLRRLVEADMIAAARELRDVDLEDELARHLEFDGELQGAEDFARRLASLHKAWISDQDQDDLHRATSAPEPAE